MKVFDKNQGAYFMNSQQAAVANSQQGGGKGAKTKVEKTIEPGPTGNRDPTEFMEMGGPGDEVLFEGEEGGEVGIRILLSRRRRQRGDGIQFRGHDWLGVMVRGLRRKFFLHPGPREDCVESFLTVW